MVGMYQGLSTFQCGAIMNKAATNILVYVLVDIHFPFSWGNAEE